MPLELEVVLDEWARVPKPADDVPVMLSPGDYVISARWRLDAMLSARIQVPGPLCVVTGI